MTPHIPAPPIEPVNVKSRAVSELPLPGEGMTMIPDSVLGPTALRPDVVHPLAPGVCFPITGTGDATRLNALYASMASSGVYAPIHVIPGGSTVFDADTPIRPSNNTVTHFYNMRIVPSFVVADPNVVNATVIGLCVQVAAAATTIATDTVRGSKTIETAAAIAAGAEIELVNNANWARNQCYTVVSCTGPTGGEYTVTLDRPLKRDFVVGDTVHLQPNRSKNVQLYGHDCTIEYRSGVRCLINTARASNILVEGFTLLRDRVGDTYTEGLTFDAGSDHCTARNIIAKGVSVGAWGTETALLDNVHAEELDDASTGLQCAIGACGCTDVTLLNCTGHGSTNGLLISLITTDAWPAEDVTVVGGSYSGNKGPGVLISSTATGLLKFVGVKVLDNNTATAPGSGIDFDVEEGCAANIQFEGHLRTNTYAGFRLRSCVARVSGLFEQSAGAEAGSLFTCSKSAKVTFEDAQMTVRRGNYAIAAYEATTELTVRKTRIVIASTASLGMGIVASAAKVDVDTLVVTDEGTTTYGVYVTDNGSVRAGKNMDVSTCDNKVTIDTGTVSRGTSTLTGTTPVSIAFPGLTAQDHVLITRTSVSGTPGHITVAQTAGVGFTVVSTEASDVGTFTYSIE